MNNNDLPHAAGAALPPATCSACLGGSANGWQPPETAPRDIVILVDTGYPWPLMALWDGQAGKWAVAVLNVEGRNAAGESLNVWWETEYECAILRWREVPKPNAKLRDAASITPTNTDHDQETHTFPRGEPDRRRMTAGLTRQLSLKGGLRRAGLVGGESLIQHSANMTQEEHLKKIAAKCRELLAVAEKRTPEKWTVTGRDAKDAAFIASCAGPAEAGWRATIAAIEIIQHNKWWHLSYDIIAAWPEELL